MTLSIGQQLVILGFDARRPGGQFAVALLVRRTVRVGCGPSVLLRASSTYSWYCRGRLRSARGWQATPRCSVLTKLSSHPAWRLCVRSPPHQPLYRAAHHLIEKGFSRARSLSTLPSLPPSLARSLPASPRSLALGTGVIHCGSGGRGAWPIALIAKMQVSPVLLSLCSLALSEAQSVSLSLSLSTRRRTIRRSSPWP